MATSPNPPVIGLGVPLEVALLNVDFGVSYERNTLDSLDILDALGVYDSTGWSRSASGWLTNRASP